MRIFEFFFKYRPLVYQKGTLGFQLLGSRWLFLLFALAAVAAAIYFYRSIGREKRSPVLVALRAITFVILLFMLLRPVLNVSTVLPQDSYMAVLIDNSASMTIKDDGTTSRAEQLQKEMQTSDFIKRLSDKFKVRIFRFDKDAERIDRLDRMTFDGKRTRTESAIDLLHQELGTVPLSGVVLISDGVDNASQDFSESLARLETRRIPFYTVGVGGDRITNDAEIVKLSSPRDMLKESTASVDVAYKGHGMSGRKGTIQVRENNVLLKSEEVTMPGDGEIGEKSIDLPVKNEGSRLFTFSIQVDGDRIAENNVLDSLMTVRNDHPQILYIEGEPRWEFKYIRRAIEDDPNIRLVTLLRTSQNKFYRQGIENDAELKDGFPKTKEELYKYKGLIFGSIESTFFSQDQQNMVVDFVSNRGGGFLMSGGRNSFSAGKYQSSPIADILPVQLSSDKAPILEKLKMLVTEYGKTHNLMRLSADANANVKQWSELPPLGDFNKTLDAKVGGIVLARGQADNGDSPILMAYQRYGRGRAMAFTSSDSWHWQMEMDHTDQSFEVFWKQILRWLVSSSPEPVMVDSDKDTYLPGDAVHISADISDKSFTRLNNAHVTVKMTGPDGTVQTIPLDWSGAQDGVYQTQVTAGDEGVYQMEVNATQGEQDLGSYHTAFQVHDRPVEYYNASLDAGALRSVANQTGGRYYPLANMGDIPDDAVYVDGESSFVEQKELWDVPMLFMLLCITLGGEWFWRKRKGLA